MVACDMNTDKTKQHIIANNHIPNSHYKDVYRKIMNNQHYAFILKATNP